MYMNVHVHVWNIGHDRVGAFTVAAMWDTRANNQLVEMGMGSRMVMAEMAEMATGWPLLQICIRAVLICRCCPCNFVP